MKVICMNPQELLDDKEIYDRLQNTSINVLRGKLVDFLQVSCLSAIRNNTQADITAAFRRCALDKSVTWDLPKMEEFFAINNFVKEEDDYVIYLNYLTEKATKKRTKEEIAKSKTTWESINSIFGKLAPIEYTQPEEEEITRIILEKYMKDFITKGNIVIDDSNIIGHKELIYYLSKEKSYPYNGESIIVTTRIDGLTSRESSEVFPNDKYRIYISLIRKGKNGETEPLATIQKRKNYLYEKGNSYYCDIGSKSYIKSDTKTILHDFLNRIEHTIGEETYTKTDIPEAEFQEFMKGLVSPEKIEEYTNIIRNMITTNFEKIDNPTIIDSSPNHISK